MYVSEEKIGKTYRGTSGFAKGLVFKITSRDEKARTCVIHTYSRDFAVAFDEMDKVDFVEVSR